MRNTTGRQRGLSQRQAAAILLLPFLTVYAAFLVYPFFNGVWISLHDWEPARRRLQPRRPQLSWGSTITSGTLWGAEHQNGVRLPARS